MNSQYGYNGPDKTSAKKGNPVKTVGRVLPMCRKEHNILVMDFTSKVTKKVFQGQPIKDGPIKLTRIHLPKIPILLTPPLISTY